MRRTEQALSFDCAGTPLLGVLTLPLQAPETAVVVEEDAVVVVQAVATFVDGVTCQVVAAAVVDEEVEALAADGEEVGGSRQLLYLSYTTPNK